MHRAHACVMILTILLHNSTCTCIGTHGSGIAFSNIAAMVTTLELINGDGMILNLSPQVNKDIFKAAQVTVM